MLCRAAALTLAFFALDVSVGWLLERGMLHYFGLDRNPEVLCVGHSHTVLGIDALRIEKELSLPTAKYAVAGANVFDRLAMLRHALSLSPRVRAVVYDVDARMFDVEGLSSASYALFLPFMGSPVMAEYVRGQATRQEYWCARLFRTTRFRDQTLNIAVRGLLNQSENKKPGTMSEEQYRGYLTREAQRRIRVEPQAVACFEETLDELSRLGIRVFLVYLPVVDLLNEPVRPEHDQVVATIRAIAGRHGATLLDYNALYEHDHSLFADPRHLNLRGNDRVTTRLISDLRTGPAG